MLVIGGVDSKALKAIENAVNKEMYIDFPEEIEFVCKIPKCLGNDLTQILGDSIFERGEYEYFMTNKTIIVDTYLDFQDLPKTIQAHLILARFGGEDWRFCPLMFVRHNRRFYAVV